MADHPNVEQLRKGYAAFETGDLDTIRELMADGMVWHTPGGNALAGTYEGKEAVFGFFGKLLETTGGTFRNEIHDILANDTHGAVMVESTAQRPDGRSWTGRAVMIWHLADGKATEAWIFNEDQAAADAFFS